MERRADLHLCTDLSLRAAVVSLVPSSSLTPPACTMAIEKNYSTTTGSIASHFIENCYFELKAAAPTHTTAGMPANHASSLVYSFSVDKNQNI